MIGYIKKHYDEDGKKKKKEYYLMNRNPINSEFSNDLIKLFKEV